MKTNGKPLKDTIRHFLKITNYNGDKELEKNKKALGDNLVKIPVENKDMITQRRKQRSERFKRKN